MNTKMKYLLIGIVFGLMFPIGAIMLEVITHKSWDIIMLHKNNTLLYMVDTAPIFLGIFAYLGGVQNYKSIEASKMLDKKLEELQILMVEIEEQNSKLESTNNKISSISDILYDNTNQIDAEFKNMNVVVSELNHNGQSILDLKEDIYTSIGITKEHVNAIGDIMHNTNESVNAFTVNINDLHDDSDKMLNNLSIQEEHVKNMADNITEIGDLKNTVDAIASQIQMLSLNASIEAARAGESGRGFSVVANEIQNLAIATNSATQKIEKSVENAFLSYDALNKSTENMNNILNIFKDNLLTIREASSSIENAQEQNMKESTLISDALTKENTTIHTLYESLNTIIDGIHKVSMLRTIALKPLHSIKIKS